MGQIYNYYEPRPGGQILMIISDKGVYKINHNGCCLLIYFDIFECVLQVYLLFLVIVVVLDFCWIFWDDIKESGLPRCRSDMSSAGLCFNKNINFRVSIEGNYFERRCVLGHDKVYHFPIYLIPIFQKRKKYL